MTEKNEVIGKYATADLKVGDYILASKLSTVPAAENAYLYNLDGTKRAISVTIKSFATGLRRHCFGHCGRLPGQG